MIATRFLNKIMPYDGEEMTLAISHIDLMKSLKRKKFINETFFRFFLTFVRFQR
jgi:hypothetical protein